MTAAIKPLMCIAALLRSGIGAQECDATKAQQA